MLILIPKLYAPKLSLSTSCRSVQQPTTSSIQIINEEEKACIKGNQGKTPPLWTSPKRQAALTTAFNAGHAKGKKLPSQRHYSFLFAKTTKQFPVDPSFSLARARLRLAQLQLELETARRLCFATRRSCWRTTCRRAHGRRCARCCTLTWSMVHRPRRRRWRY